MLMTKYSAKIALIDMAYEEPYALLITRADNISACTDYEIIININNMDTLEYGWWFTRGNIQDWLKWGKPLPMGDFTESYRWVRGEGKLYIPNVNIVLMQTIVRDVSLAWMPRVEECTEDTDGE